MQFELVLSSHDDDSFPKAFNLLPNIISLSHLVIYQPYVYTCFSFINK